MDSVAELVGNPPANRKRADRHLADFAAQPISDSLSSASDLKRLVVGIFRASRRASATFPFETDRYAVECRGEIAHNLSRL